MFVIVVNFLRVNSEKCFIVVCFSKIVIAITISRKLVRKGKRICLFVYYAKLISAELQMIVKGSGIEGGLEPWTGKVG